MRIPLLTLLFCFGILTGNATNYYISASGDDHNNGTSSLTPWKTIAKVNDQKLLPGDSILFRRGDTWHEELIVSSSGTTDKCIIFTAYGTGNKPIITGADIVKGWRRLDNQINSSIWGIVNPNASSTRAMVIINDSIYSEVASRKELNSPRKYFIQRSALRDSLLVSSDSDPNLSKTEVSIRDYCIVAKSFKNIHHVNFINLQARYAGNSGLALYGIEGVQFPGYCTVDGCDFYGNRQYGCVAYDGHSNDTFKNSSATYSGNGFYAWNSDNTTIHNCATSHNIKYTVGPNNTDGHGYGGYKSNNWIVENCNSDNDDDAIHADAAHTPCNAIIRFNKIYNAKAGSSGIGVGNLSAGATIQIYYNLIVNPSGEAFSSYNMNSGSVHVYNNTMYINDASGTNGAVFLKYGNNFIFKNNIIVRKGGNYKTLFAILNDQLPISNYNQFYQNNPVASPFWFHYNQLQLRSLNEWFTITGQDKNSQSGDPEFTNPTSDWTLQPSSPCIDKGIDVGLTQDIQGNPIIGLPDIGAYEYMPSTTTSVERNKSSLTVYPNPAHDILNSTVYCDSLSLVEFKVYDLQGRAVMSTKGVSQCANSASARLDISKLKTGSYWVEAVSGQVRKSISGFIKM